MEELQYQHEAQEKGSLCASIIRRRVPYSASCIAVQDSDAGTLPTNDAMIRSPIFVDCNISRTHGQLTELADARTDLWRASCAFLHFYVGLGSQLT